MWKKILRVLGKLQIIRIGSYAVKGNSSDLIDAEISSKHSSSGFYGKMQKTMQANSHENHVHHSTRFSRIFSRVVGLICIVCGLLIFEAGRLSALILIVVGLFFLPPVVSRIGRLQRPYMKVAFVIFMLLLCLVFFPAAEESDPLTVLPISSGIADTQDVTDFSYHLARLIMAYYEAYRLEELSYTIGYQELSAQEFSRLLTVIEIKRGDVALLSQGLDQFKQKAGESVAIFAPTPRRRHFFSTVYAIDYDSVADSPRELEALDEEMRMQYREQYKAEWERAEAIKAAYPSLNWLNVVQAVFDEDAQNALQRIGVRNEDIQKIMKDDVSYIDRQERDYETFQTANKVTLYAGSLPASMAAGGIITAANVVIGGVDVAISVGKSVDLIFNGAEPSQVKKELALGEGAVSTIATIMNIQSLLKSPKERDKDNILFLVDASLKEFSSDNIKPQQLVVNIDQAKEEVALFTTTKSQKNTGGSNYYDGKPWLTPTIRVTNNMKGWTSEQLNAHKLLMTQVIQYLNSPGVEQYTVDYLQKKITDLEKKNEDERKAREMKKIIERKDTERAAQAQQKRQKNLQKEAQNNHALADDLAQLGVTPDPEPQPEPTPLPPPLPSAPSVVPKQVVTDCNLCRSNGMACACGTSACRCCSNNDDSCDAFDL